MNLFTKIALPVLGCVGLLTLASCSSDKPKDVFIDYQVHGEIKDDQGNILEEGYASAEEYITKNFKFLSDQFVEGLKELNPNIFATLKYEIVEYGSYTIIDDSFFSDPNHTLDSDKLLKHDIKQKYDATKENLLSSLYSASIKWTLNDKPLVDSDQIPEEMLAIFPNTLVSIVAWFDSTELCEEYCSVSDDEDKSDELLEKRVEKISANSSNLSVYGKVSQPMPFN
ncbi:MAG: hypothetical protein ACRC5M_01995 [Anaeroplasmataceae bacterium]